MSWAGRSGLTAGALALISAATVGVLGPVLAATKERPFFLLSVGLGQTSRVEGLVSAVWLIADFTLVALFCRAGRKMWEELTGMRGAWAALMIGLLVLGAGWYFEVQEQIKVKFFEILPIVGLIAGGGLPGLALLCQKDESASKGGIFWGKGGAKRGRYWGSEKHEKS